jgi:hypothetical protein
VSRAAWDAAPELWSRRVLADAASNPHGLAALLATPDGEYTSIRTQDSALLVATLSAAKWDRVWVHARYGTGGANSLENTHGFCAGGVWYMHNGFIRQAPASSMPVDSMAIGKWISEGTVYDKLFRESYANVFLVSPRQGVYTVVRGGPGGQLHTDGHGNYSTVPCGDVSQPVAAGTKLNWACPKTVPPARWAWTLPSATTPTREAGQATYTYRGGSMSRLRQARRRAEDTAEILPSRQPIPAPGTMPRARVFVTMAEYWRAVTADEVEFDMETYREIADRVYNDD